jgi:sugar/nucleoside kinase (ribokinase family)
VADFDVLVLGDANPDLVLRGDAEPVFGQQEKVVDSALLTVGGSGAIFACAAARLGMRVAFCGVVGDDPFGQFVREELVARGVDVRGLIVDPRRSTGVTVVLSRPEDRAMLTAPGTIGDLTAERVDPDLLRATRFLHVPSFFLQEGLRPGLRGLFETARDAGVTTCVDPNWDPSQVWNRGLMALLPFVDVVLPNAVEASAIAGVEDVEVAAERLSEVGNIVAVKRGADGGIARRRGEVARDPGISVSVVDATGAGDAFDAGFVLGLLEGWPLGRALALANVCGGLSCRAVGGVAAQPTRAEALERVPSVAAPEVRS